MKLRILLTAMICLLIQGTTIADDLIRVRSKMFHLRSSGDREWATFPETSSLKELVLPVQAGVNKEEGTLLLRQQDVKQTWNVELNGTVLGKLVPDANDQQLLLTVPPKTMQAEKNQLRIYQAGKQIPDDIRVGEIVYFAEPKRDVLSESFLVIEVVDGASKQPLPCRITIMNSDGTLVATTAESNKQQAVRTGVIYASEGKTRFRLPAGDYLIAAGRGFEYGVDFQRVKLQPRDMKKIQLKINREVDTSGYVSCDTHIHTLTHSGHGDSSMAERMITLAGEQIEFPIATDHNKQIDYEPLSRKLKVRQYFTPVIGNEVTTKWGHFNVFPVQAEGPIPDYKLPNWDGIFESIYETPNVKVAILNHARDIHSKYRPFDRKNHLSQTGENLDGWRLRANAMEIINSGATQTDFMQLYHDWFGMLNRGVFLTPVGCSDSHDVSRYIVGQARTYIQAEDKDPSKIDVSQTIQNFVDGKVLLSYGLFTQIKVNGKYGPGTLVPASEDLEVSLTVSGPGWVAADQISLYANGELIRREDIDDSKPQRGVKWQGTWKLKQFPHDCHLVAIATGPGVTSPSWPLAKPYQPDSPEYKSHVVGSTGAVWIDADGDGKKTPAYVYAERLVKEHKGDLSALLKSLANYDLAVSQQAASLLRAGGKSPFDPEMTKLLQDAAKQVQIGFALYAEAWRSSQIARTTN
ncbi:CehA/McbA family metallohydrolase [uncultured Gimesia sp.]|uniref:CehA/McbA family metallohydrolase n=1 Tax=uncultured Gimesia sp. TaxID=1678688 RepID=UPI0030DD63AB|tara:strand:- start:45024 stop:47099 length:2076 start_codon:yes stop_codon:yes gene_type:complete